MGTMVCVSEEKDGKVTRLNTGPSENIRNLTKGIKQGEIQGISFPEDFLDGNKKFRRH